MSSRYAAESVKNFSLMKFYCVRMKLKENENEDIFKIIRESVLHIVKKVKVAAFKRNKQDKNYF